MTLIFDRHAVSMSSETESNAAREYQKGCMCMCVLAACYPMAEHMRPHVFELRLLL